MSNTILKKEDIVRKKSGAPRLMFDYTRLESDMLAAYGKERNPYSSRFPGSSLEVFINGGVGPIITMQDPRMHLICKMLQTISLYDDKHNTQIGISVERASEYAFEFCSKMFFLNDYITEEDEYGFKWFDENGVRKLCPGDVIRLTIINSKDEIKYHKTVGIVSRLTADSIRIFVVNDVTRFAIMQGFSVDKSVINDIEITPKYIMEDASMTFQIERIDLDEGDTK